MRYERKAALEFKGIDLSTGKVHMDPGAAQIDINGDRRRFGAWRTRAGYARLIAAGTGSFTKTSVATDDFDRANGALGANWDDYSVAPNLIKDLNIATNQVRIEDAVSGSRAAAAWIGDTVGDDQYSEVTINVLPDTQELGVFVRSSEAGGGYLFRYYREVSSGLERFTLENVTDWGQGGGTTLATLDSYAGLGAVTDALELRALGNELFCYIGGILILTATDATHSSGNPGIFASNPIGIVTRGEVDDFDMGTVLLSFPAAVVTSEPSRIYAFERDDNDVRIMVAHGTVMNEFAVGGPEWTG
jgi:hypothetical protein